VAIFVGCVLVNIPVGIVTRVQAGYQEGFSANLWQSVGSVMCLAALLLTIHFRGPLPTLVLAMAGTPILALLMNAVVLFGVQRRWLFPSWSYVTTEASKDLWRLGALFFTLQLAFAISYSSDNLVIARILGPKAVTQYGVPCKLFSLVSTLVSLVVNPLWPAHGEALARRDYPWIRKTLIRSITVAGAVSISLGTLLLLFGNRIIHAWVGPSVRPPSLLLAALGIWAVVGAISMAVAVFYYGLSIMRFQLVVVPLASLVNITLSVYLTRHVGIPGVVYGSVLSQIFIFLIPSALYLRRYLKSIRVADAEPRWAAEHA